MRIASFFASLLPAGRSVRLCRLLPAALSGLLLALTALVVPSTPAQAMTQAEVNNALRSHEGISRGLLNAQILALITRECDSLEPPPRLIRNAYFLGLYNQARRLGFSRAQIEAFVEDEAEQARVEQEARSYIRSTGADPDNAQSVCALGRAEMRARTEIGRRLRER